VRIVLDTDAWVSAILLPGGTADRAVLAVLAGKATAGQRRQEQTEGAGEPVTV